MLFSKLALLAVAAVATAHTEMSFFTDDLEALNSLNIAELIEGWEEQGLILQGVHFHDEPRAANHTAVDDRDLHPAALEGRAPAVSCGSVACESSSYHLFTPAQEKFITGKACPVVANYGPAVAGAVISLYTAKAVCGGNGPCTLVVTIIGAVAGANPSIIKALNGACEQSYQSILSSCSTEGGAQQCTSSGEKETYEVYATSTSYTCKATHCSKVTCNSKNDNCQDY